MISLDTELMKQLVESCVTANNNIEDAVAALAGITSHNDWGCKEKTRIDEYTETNKQKIKQLQECSDSFLRVLREVTHDFESTEQSIADMASNVDASISGILTVASAAVSGVKPELVTIGMTPEKILLPAPSLIDTIMGDLENSLEGFNPGSPIGSYLAKTMQEPIAACLYDAIKL